MNKLDKQFRDLVQDILENGTTKSDRTGTGTISVFGRTIRHKMSDGFPLLTTKKMYFKGIATELLWFLRGDTNIKYLLDNDCNIWTGDAYKKYYNEISKTTYSDNDIGITRPYTKEEFVEKIKTDNEFAEKWGDLGPIYGKQWRSWKNVEFDKKYCQKEDSFHNYFDQITNLINDLKTNPDSRRLMVNAWNVGDIDKMTLPPCHYGFQIYTRELSLEERCDWKAKKDNVRNTSSQEIYTFGSKEVGSWMDEDNVPKRAISLIWNQRSVDTFLGLPFNIASYGLLLEIIAKIVNMVPDELIGNLGDTHLYLNHIEQAKEQIGTALSFPERYKLWKGSDVPTDFHTAKIWEASQMMDYDGIQKETREPFELPKLNINTEFWLTESGECGVGKLSSDIDSLIKGMGIDDFQLEGYESHSSIKAPLSN